MYTQWLVMTQSRHSGANVSVRVSGFLHNIEPTMWFATEYGDTMIRRISLATISLCIGACASSSPEAPAPAVTDPSAGAAAVASDIPSAPPGGVTHDPDAPVVEMSASALAASKPDEIVCRRETQAGTKMSKRVCRTRAEIEARAAKDQETLRRSRATQSGSDCALNGNC
jgi:hypothetical protein